MKIKQSLVIAGVGAATVATGLSAFWVGGIAARKAKRAIGPGPLAALRMKSKRVRAEDPSDEDISADAEDFLQKAEESFAQDMEASVAPAS